MLKDARRATRGLAWILDSQHKKALSVRGWRPHPVGLGCHFFAPDFALFAETPWLWGEEIELTAPEPEPLPKLMHRVDPSSADFAALFEEIQTEIRTDHFAKVVPIVCETLAFSGPLHVGMFPGAFSIHDHQISYGYEFGGEGLCGVTPEVLFSVEDQVLQTMALAGTGRVGGPSLLDDPKERREHDLVIEHILSELKDWGHAEVGETRERPYRQLKHLYTPIRMELQREVGFMDLVVRLHPTAALGGFPRKSAVEWLEEQDFHSTRGRFGAPFGFQEEGRMLCVVAIRGLQWKGERAQLSAGCGVVAESQVLKEWEELKLKRDSVLPLLGVEL